VKCERIWVGIDVGKAAHHACAVDDKGTVVFSRRVANSQADIQALIARASRAAGEVTFALDMSTGPAAMLVTMVLSAGSLVRYVPGRLVNRMSGAFAGEGKTDARDARTIAETARLRSDLMTLSAQDQVVSDLQVLTARREDLMADWVRGINRVRDLLASIFPALERALDYSTRSALILLTGFQTPGHIRQAGEHGVASWLRKHQAWSRAIAPIAAKAMRAAAEQTITLPAESVAAPLVAALASQLLALHVEMKQLDKQIMARFSDHPHAERITSVPGFGPILGAQLLAAAGGDLTVAFANPGRLAAYAGLAPVPRDSGRVQGNLHRPQRYNRTLRRVFYQAALSSIKPDGLSRTFYQRKRAEGKLHTQALIALARRLIDVIWALLRDGRIFEHHPPSAAHAA
jgi:transposase